MFVAVGAVAVVTWAGEEEVQHRADACGPACFVVGSAVNAFKMKGFAGFPTVGAEAACELFGVFEGLGAFVVADVEPHTGAVPDVGGVLVEVAEDGFVVPPDAGA